jgi:hypothetical protein
MKSKDHPKMNDDELNNHPEPKELESSDKTIENKKALKQILMLQVMQLIKKW